MALANHTKLELYGLDISNAFARADVSEELFVERPHGYAECADDGTPLYVN